VGGLEFALRGVRKGMHPTSPRPGRAPALVGLPHADVELWIAAKIDGVGWCAAGAAAGMDKAAIRRSRQRILRYLSTGDVLRRLLHRLDDVP
jgi:hypothetical protein